MDAQETGGVVAIWITPKDDDIIPCTALEVLTGPKRYMVIWFDGGRPEVDWSWHLQDGSGSVKVWEVE